MDAATVAMDNRDQLAYLDLPLSYRGGADQPQPRVTLRATFAGTAHEWQGRIVRTEGEIDPVSRMAGSQAVARRSRNHRLPGQIREASGTRCLTYRKSGGCPSSVPG